MGSKAIDRLIVNSPYEEPTKHWKHDRETRLFDLVEGRRPAGYVIASQDSRSYDDPGLFVEIPLVKEIRARVKKWREAGYPGVSSVTHRLLDYWTDRKEFEARLFFCQLEAAETLIWLTEAPVNDKAGLEIPSDGGQFQRFCAKMATGTGKTVVMAMVVAWHILNKVAYPRDQRFSKYVLVVAPGLTVKNRLSVLDPREPENYYCTFRIVPPAMFDKLRQGKVLVRNWHALNWETADKLASKCRVDKRGPKSDEAYVRDVLGDIARAKNILVINDEAHHAWRVPLAAKTKGIGKDDVEEATKWVGGLDRINRARRIIACYDFSATPLTPSGNQNSEDALFDWVISDFGLTDAIESGLVKTPRVVIQDDAIPDAKSYKSRLYHIYNDPDVKEDLKGPAEPEVMLPALVINAYNLLGADWLKTAKKWDSEKAAVPPVMITVANRTETAARVKYAFDHKQIRIDELCVPDRTLHIDSKVLKQAESTEEPIADLSIGEGMEDRGGNSERNQKPSKKRRDSEQAELLRRKVDTVGKQGKPGEKIRNVISVEMLTEGWDAKNVTHIMGLRAFSSQLLCEQVVGRGLRRTSYDVNPNSGFFEAEHVNIFGVPFTFMPHEGGDAPPPPPTPKIAVMPVAEKAEFKISWPNIIRVEHGYRTCLSLDWSKVEPLELDASQTTTLAELAPVLDGKPDITRIDEIDLKERAREFRMQRLVFETVRNEYERIRINWQGSEPALFGQLVRLAEEFMRWKGLTVIPELSNQDELMRRIVLAHNMPTIFRHIGDAIERENAETLKPVFDRDQPILSTSDMSTWYTGKPYDPALRSHINFCVHDSTLEKTAASALDDTEGVEAWVKNDHLGFEVFYVYRGAVHKYRPDYLVRFSSGDMLVLETKGLEGERDRAKFSYLDEWVRAVNSHGGFGHWHWAVSKSPGETRDVLAKYGSGKLE